MQCWLVERGVNDRGLVRLVYATPNGSRHLVKEQSAMMLDSVTAAIEVNDDRLEPVDDPSTQKRYESEVQRVRQEYSPSDPI